jgi:succinate dehydrogenase / fumarate reductase flavoprotein subunit
LGEANCADHGANRLGANSLLQACVDGYYIVSQTLMDYLAENGHAVASESLIAQSKTNVKSQLEKLLSVRGTKTAENFHKELGDVLYANCGLSRKAPSMVAALDALNQIRTDFYQNIMVPGKLMGLNPELEKAVRVADFLDLAPLLITDALDREESCGAHFREEFQTEDGEPKRDDEAWGFVSAWEYNGLQKPIRHEDVLTFEEVAPIKRSYK